MILHFHCSECNKVRYVNSESDAGQYLQFIAQDLIEDDTIPLLCGDCRRTNKTQIVLDEIQRNLDKT